MIHAFTCAGVLPSQYNHVLPWQYDTLGWFLVYHMLKCVMLYVEGIPRHTILLTHWGFSSRVYLFSSFVGCGLQDPLKNSEGSVTTLGAVTLSMENRIPIWSMVSLRMTWVVFFIYNIKKMSGIICNSPLFTWWFFGRLRASGWPRGYSQYPQCGIWPAVRPYNCFQCIVNRNWKTCWKLLYIAANFYL